MISKSEILNKLSHERTIWQNAEQTLFAQGILQGLKLSVALVETCKVTGPFPMFPAARLYRGIYAALRLMAGGNRKAAIHRLEKAIKIKS